MKILNQSLADDIQRGVPVKLNLGVGQRAKSGFFGVDIVEMDGVDAVVDLNDGLAALPDDSVEELITQHVLEHIDNFMSLMRDIHRAVTKNGKITITVPHYSNVFGYSDPTHVRFFGLYSMFYFDNEYDQPSKRKVPSFYTDVSYMVESIYIEFYREGLVDKFLGKAMAMLVNKNLASQHFYERRLSSLYHANEITYVLRPVK